MTSNLARNVLEVSDPPDPTIALQLRPCVDRLIGGDTGRRTRPGATPHATGAGGSHRNADGPGSPGRNACRARATRYGFEEQPAFNADRHGLPESVQHLCQRLRLQTPERQRVDDLGQTPGQVWVGSLEVGDCVFQAGFE